MPGGTPEEGESLVETLRREMLEETGFQVSAIHQNTIRDVFVTIPEIARVHHEFVLFTIDIEEKNAQTVEDFVTSKREERFEGNCVGSTRRSQPYQCISTRNRSRSTNTGIRGEALRTMGDVRRRFYELK